MYYVVYDLEDNFMAMYENQKELAKFFGKSVKSLQSSLSRHWGGEIKFIRCKADEKGYKVYKFKEEK